jgi:hypothetical protein
MTLLFLYKSITNRKRVTLHMPCSLKLGRYWTEPDSQQVPKSGFDIKKKTFHF